METKLNLDQVAANVISELARSIAKTLHNNIKNTVSDFKGKTEVELGLAYGNYLTFTNENNKKIKTLLYRHEAKDIYSFYECVGLRHNKREIDISDINNVLKIGKRLIITGTGGVGKSLMMKHFFLNCIKNTCFVPVLIELRGLNDFDKNSIDLQEYIYKTMRSQKFDIERKYFDYSMELGIYIFLLDGFDEVKSEIFQRVTEQIFDLSKKYSDNWYIISSRPLDDFIAWHDFNELYSLSLTKEQALSLIKKIDYEKSIKEKFYKELEDSLYDKYKSFASNPLLLTIMLLTFENRLSIPENFNDFFEQAFMTLFHTHDATKGGYKRDIRSQLSYEEFKVVFAHFCFQSFFHYDYEFLESKAIEYISESKKKKVISTNFDSSDYLKDLTNSVCMLIQDGLTYRFSHRSFQEYFAAFYTMHFDDELQKKFIRLWLKNKEFRLTSNYLDMLYGLQSSRFAKNVIVPAIKELEELFIKNGNSYEWLMGFLYESVFIGSNKNGSKAAYFIIKEDYYHEMLSRISKLENKKDRNLDRDNKFISLLEEKYGENCKVSISTLKMDGIIDVVLQYCPWIKERYEVAINYLRTFEKPSYSRKRSFESILEEL